MIMKESINQVKKEIAALQESIELIQARKEEVSKKISDKRQEINDIKAERMKDFLGPAVENLQCESDGSYFQFNKVGERSGLSGMFTVRSEFRYGGEELVKELSYYTSTCDTDAEFRRLEIIGKVASKLRSVTDEELYDFLNEGLEAKKQELNELRENRYSLDKAKNQMEKEISQHEDDITLLQLREGIDVGEKGCAWLNVGRKIESSNVFKIKITEESTSGKTATVEVTKLISGYNGDEMSYPYTFDRVKVDQLVSGTRSFLTQSKKNKERRQSKELADTAS